MGEKVWWFDDCPKCGEKDSFEHFEHDSSNLRLNECDKCGYRESFTFEEKDGVIHIEKTSPPNKGNK